MSLLKGQTAGKITVSTAAITLTDGANWVEVSYAGGNPLVQISSSQILSAISPVRIYDVTGTVSDARPIIINCEGGELINGQPSILIDCPLGSVTLIPDGAGNLQTASDAFPSNIVISTNPNTVTAQIAPLQPLTSRIIFGADFGSLTDPFMMAVSEITFNQPSSYTLEATFNLGRGNSSGTEGINIQAIFNGIPTEFIIDKSLSDVDDHGTKMFSREECFFSGDTLSFDMTASFIQGAASDIGLYPRVSPIVGWGFAPSARIRILRHS